MSGERIYHPDEPSRGIIVQVDVKILRRNESGQSSQCVEFLARCVWHLQLPSAAVEFDDHMSRTARRLANEITLPVGSEQVPTLSGAVEKQMIAFDFDSLFETMRPGSAQATARLR